MFSPRLTALSYAPVGSVLFASKGVLIALGAAIVFAAAITYGIYMLQSGEVITPLQLAGTALAMGGMVVLARVKASESLAGK